MNPSDFLPECQTLARIYAKKFVRRFPFYAAVYDDLYQECLICAWRAAEKFDPSRGLQFSTYASHWLRAGIQQHFRRTDRRGTNHLTESLDEPFLDGTDAKIQPVAEESEERNVIDYERVITILRSEVNRENRERRKNDQSELSSRVGIVLERRLRGDTLAAIAESMGVKRQRVEQIFKQGKGILDRVMEIAGGQ